MKKTILGLLLALTTVTSWGFDPDNLNTVTVTNGTGKDIEYLFVKPEDAGTWGADVLGSSNTLDNGGSHEFNILYADESNLFNFLAIDEDDQVYQVSNVKITDGKPATVRFTSRNKTAAVDFEYTEVKLNNTLDYDIHYLFLSPNESEHWGADMLDSETILEAGESHSLMVPVRSRVHKYNLMAVDEDNDTYSFNIEISSKEDSYEYDIEISDLDTEDDEESEE